MCIFDNCSKSLGCNWAKLQVGEGRFLLYLGFNDFNGVRYIFREGGCRQDEKNLESVSRFFPESERGYDAILGGGGREEDAKVAVGNVV